MATAPDSRPSSAADTYRTRTKHTVLAVDDEDSIRKSYGYIFKGQYNLLLAKNGEEALELIDKNHVDLMILDLTMPGVSGEDVLAELQDRGNATPVIVVTASESITSAVEAMKLGACEYVQKPFDVEAILHDVERVLREEQDRRELDVLREAELRGFESLIGTTDAMKHVLEAAHRAVEVDSEVLITGESGTGKDLVARAIHSAGPRADHPFVNVSCCAISDNLVESELFGYAKNAFTGAERDQIGKMKVADGGTIFLDEIGEMPINIQPTLLHVLQNREFYPVGSTKIVDVDIRVICATNRELLEAIDEGMFRKDLYYRINVLHIEMPPLRKRREDIPMLVNHFVAKHRPRVNAQTQDVAPKAMAKLAAYSWPGNVRELENYIERLLVYYGREEVIGLEHIKGLLPDEDDRSLPLDEFEGLPLEEATQKMEAYLIRRALEKHNNVQSHAADALGTTRRILKYKMDQLGLESD